MTFSLFDHDAPHGEASRLVAFSSNRLDRRSEHRTETELGDALNDPATRYFAISKGRLAMRVDGNAPEGLLTAADLALMQPRNADAVLIGWDEAGVARIAMPVGIQPDDLPEPFKAIDTRVGLPAGPDGRRSSWRLCARHQPGVPGRWPTGFAVAAASAMTPESGGYRRQMQGLRTYGVSAHRPRRHHA
jgi:NAD+ diphosphatase